jgi:hypothetical protein
LNISTPVTMVLNPGPCAMSQTVRLVSPEESV